MIFLLADGLNIWERLADMGAVAVLMGVAIVWLSRELNKKDKTIKEKDKKIEEALKLKDEQIASIAKKKDEQISDQNDYIRDSSKETLAVLSDVDKTLDRIIDTQKNLSEKTQEKIQNLKESVEAKIDAIIDNLSKRN